ncbi:hypothetical protein [Novosphingobium sp.]|uniref:hypothetical protein n=1 Tax=Novosphingobium sp. TaxID=1874826 RepID=UPI00286D9B1C|nr:hypothetical protein [Novosphingobium sp.]
MDQAGLSAGEVGGVFAGVVAALAALGKGLAWLLNWQGARSDRKADRLRVWEESLDRRDKEYRQQLEHDLEELRAAHLANATEISALRNRFRALRGAALELVIEVRAISPDSPALKRADAMLRTAFPVEVVLPADLTELVNQLGEI